MEIDQTPTNRAQFRQVYEAVASRAQRTTALLPDVRAFAQATGALPAPVEAAPALPAPDAAPAVEERAPIVYADFKRYRAEEREQREAAGRAAYDAWLASQQGAANV